MVGPSLILLISLAIAGCAHRPPHPPRFADFRRAFDLGMESAEAVRQQVEVFERGALSPGELLKILAAKNSASLVGAATQARVDDPTGLELALRATVVDPTNPITWAAMSYKTVTLIKSDVGVRERNLDLLANAVEHWKTLEPLNSVPVYLEARYLLFVTNAPRANELVAIANRMDQCVTYEEPIRACVEHVYRFHDYPHYSALVLASGHSTGSLHLTMLGKDLLKELPLAATTLPELVVLGKRVATGKTMLAELLGLTLQLNAIDNAAPNTLGIDRSTIASRRGYIQRVAKFLSSPALKGVSEKRWIQFYEDSSIRGEMKATEDLAREQGHTF